MHYLVGAMQVDAADLPAGKHGRHLAGSKKTGAARRAEDRQQSAGCHVTERVGWLSFVYIQHTGISSA